MPEIVSYTPEQIDIIVKSCRGLRKQLIEYCMRYTQTFEDAEDCVSFAFTAMVETLNKGTVINYPKAWLYKVSLNEAIRLEKERARLMENDYLNNDYKDSVIENSGIYEPDYLDEIIDDGVIKHCALKIIQSLTDDEKALYLKYYTQHKGLKDIANELGLSYVAVRKRHQRLKEHLDELIQNANDNYFEEGRESVENR